MNDEIHILDPREIHQEGERARDYFRGIPDKFPFTLPGEPVKFGQHVIPYDPDLNQKLGMKDSSRILVFAGCFGDWSHALCGRNQVHYTDVSPGMASFVQRQGYLLASVTVGEASLRPHHKEEYDWSFTFEATIPPKNLALALLRSLLNSEGAKVVWRPNYIYSHDKIMALFGNFAGIYDCAFSFGTVSIRGAYFTERVCNGGQDVIRDGVCVGVYSLATNPRSRENAWKDIQTLCRVHEGKDQGKNASEGCSSELERLVKLTAFLHDFEF